MCTPHVRVDQASFDSLVETLTRGREMSRYHSDNRDYPAASGYLLGTIEHALIVLEIHRESCSFEEGFTSSEIQKLSDQAALLSTPITHTMDYSQKPELHAEVCDKELVF
jgi:hypothetical protein